jgi:hypothetical protein
MKAPAMVPVREEEMLSRASAGHLNSETRVELRNLKKKRALFAESLSFQRLPEWILLDWRALMA